MTAVSFCIVSVAKRRLLESLAVYCCWLLASLLYILSQYESHFYCSGIEHTNLEELFHNDLQPLLLFCGSFIRDLTPIFLKEKLPVASERPRLTVNLDSTLNFG